MVETFFKFYSNIKTTRCLQFIVSKRWTDHPETRKIVEKHGFYIVGKGRTQSLTIIDGLKTTKEMFGNQVVVSVNDLDHLLVWFDLDGNPHRYSSYTDIVKLYIYELLSTKGCPDDKNVHEKYVVPCTCLMKNNQEYMSTHDDGILWSEYGVSNRFHPTANFYLNDTLKQAVSNRTIGTVFSNLRNMKVSFRLTIREGITMSLGWWICSWYQNRLVMVRRRFCSLHTSFLDVFFSQSFAHRLFDTTHQIGNINVHHRLGFKTKEVVTWSTMCGVIHSRTENMVQSLAKYQHYLLAAEKNSYRNTKATISGRYNAL